MTECLARPPIPRLAPPSLPRMPARRCRRWQARLARAASQLRQPPPETAATSPQTTVDLGFAPSTDTGTALQQLQLHGFCVLPGVLPAEQVAQLRADVTAHIDDMPAVLADAEESPGNRKEGLKYYYPEVLRMPHVPGVEGGGYRGDGNRAISGYVRFAPHWGNRGCETARVSDVVSGSVGQDYKLVYTTAFSSHSADKIGWHHDDPQFQQFGQPLDVMGRLTTLWMLTDFSAENGATLSTRPAHARAAAGAAAARCSYKRDRELIAVSHAQSSQGATSPAMCLDLRKEKSPAPPPPRARRWSMPWAKPATC
jgi:hypothetical protein